MSQQQSPLEQYFSSQTQGSYNSQATNLLASRTSQNGLSNRLSPNIKGSSLGSRYVQISQLMFGKLKLVRRMLPNYLIYSTESNKNNLRHNQDHKRSISHLHRSFSH